VSTQSGAEDAAFNAELYDGSTRSPLIMHAGEAGQTDCASYDTAHWLGFTPLKILSVTFADGSAAKQWAVVSDLGGTAEVAAT
jgi:hypothetical protein